MLAQHKATSKYFAHKVFDRKNQKNDSEVIDYKKEAKALQMCRGIEETIQMYEIIENTDNVIIVTNYIAGDDLVNYALHNEI